MKQHTSLAITCALIVIALISCASTDKTQLRSDKLVPEDTSQAEDKFITRMAGIDSIEIRMLESMPVQVKVIVGGYLSDGCTRIDRITRCRIRRSGRGCFPLLVIVTFTSAEPS